MAIRLQRLQPLFLLLLLFSARPSFGASITVLDSFAGAGASGSLLTRGTNTAFFFTTGSGFDWGLDTITLYLGSVGTPSGYNLWLYDTGVDGMPLTNLSTLTSATPNTTGANIFTADVAQTLGAGTTYALVANDYNGVGNNYTLNYSSITPTSSDGWSFGADRCLQSSGGGAWSCAANSPLAISINATATSTAAPEPENALLPLLLGVSLLAVRRRRRPRA